MENKVINYWAKRVEDFSQIRENELNDEISQRWLNKINEYVQAKPLSILDVGTGVGYFAIILAKQGHQLTGIDLTPSMIEKAKQLAKKQDTEIDFQVMDGADLTFADQTFDLVITRNLTWTLPDCKKAYQEWFRVLKPEGVLLNFDACYSHNVLNNQKHHSHVPLGKVYGHQGMTNELEKENAIITLSMEIATKERPQYDLNIIHNCGFTKYGCQRYVGKEILKEYDLLDAPMFLVWARK